MPQSNARKKTYHKIRGNLVYPDHFELVDVKARGEVQEKISKKTGRKYKTQWSSKWDDAAVKIKCATERFPYLRWAYYFREADGRWTREDV
ncbi:MAG: hypothetical protein AB1847_03275 [bacterium]